MDRFKVGAGFALLAIGCTMLISSPVLAGTQADVTSQVRLRYEGSDRSFAPDVNSTHGVYQRVRVRLDMEHDSGARGVVVLQDSRKWGQEGDTTTDTMNADLSQGYISLDCSHVDGLTIDAGRQEWSYGRERVIGALDWSNVGRSFDGVRLHQNLGNHWLDLGFAKVSENTLAGTDENVVLAVLHLNVPDSNFDIEPFLVYKEIQDARMYTTAFGNYASLESGRFWIGEDFVYQTSEVMGTNLDGFLFAIDAAMDFSADGDGKSGGAIGFASYSGNDPTDDSDASYDQLYPTGHKFHGYMDVAQPFVDAFGLGLQDLHVKAWIKTNSGMKVVVAAHSFASDVEVAGVTGDGNDVGKELNLVVAGKHSSGAATQLGLGYFLAGDLMDAMAAGGDAENAAWAYLQTTVDF